MRPLLPLVLVLASVAGVAVAQGREGFTTIYDGAPPQAAPGQAPAPQPDPDSRMRGYTHPERSCTFGPFTRQIDPFEASRLADTARSGREALAQIMALEEDIDLPPYTFLIATEPDGGDDMTCRD